jgi:hypothetical protein
MDLINSQKHMMKISVVAILFAAMAHFSGNVQGQVIEVSEREFQTTQNA